MTPRAVEMGREGGVQSNSNDMADGPLLSRQTQRKSPASLTLRPIILRWRSGRYVPPRCPRLPLEPPCYRPAVPAFISQTIEARRLGIELVTLHHVRDLFNLTGGDDAL